MEVSFQAPMYNSLWFIVCYISLITGKHHFKWFEKGLEVYNTVYVSVFFLQTFCPGTVDVSCRQSTDLKISHVCDDIHNDTQNQLKHMYFPVKWLFGWVWEAFSPHKHSEILLRRQGP